jgi:hypothetical protein
MGQHSSPMTKDLLQTIAILIFSFSLRVGNGQTDEWLCPTERAATTDHDRRFQRRLFSVFKNEKKTDASVLSVCGASVSFKIGLS